MGKKADLSLNVIIIAVIGLIVLIVLVAIFGGKLNIFSKSTKEVSTGYEGKCMVPGVYGRECKSATDCVGAHGSVVQGTYSDCPTGCCQL